MTKRKLPPVSSDFAPLAPTAAAALSVDVFTTGINALNGLINRDEAETVAIQALAFVAGNDRLLPRFLQLTGIEAPAIRLAAREPGFLAGVLQFIAAHEPTLVEFCEQSGVAPQQIRAAMNALPLGDETYQTNT